MPLIALVSAVARRKRLKSDHTLPSQRRRWSNTIPSNPFKLNFVLIFLLICSFLFFFFFFYSAALINIFFSKFRFTVSKPPSTMNLEHTSELLGRRHGILWGWNSCDYSVADCARRPLKVRGRLWAESHYPQQSNYYGSVGRRLRLEASTQC